MRYGLTPAQVKFLQFSLWHPLRDGTIERSLETGIHGSAADAVCDALTSKGLVDEAGSITDKGRRALKSCSSAGADAQVGQQSHLKTARADRAGVATGLHDPDYQRTPQQEQELDVMRSRGDL